MEIIAATDVPGLTLSKNIKIQHYHRDSIMFASSDIQVKESRCALQDQGLPVFMLELQLLSIKQTDKCRRLCRM
jgi:hypothetical protein